MSPPDHTHFRYVQCDVPEGSSLAEWGRRDGPAPCHQVPGALRRLVARVRMLAVSR